MPPFVTHANVLGVLSSNGEQQPGDGQSIDQSLRYAQNSPGTPQRAPNNRRPSVSPAGSLGSMSSDAVRTTSELSSTTYRVMNENVAPAALLPAMPEFFLSTEQVNGRPRNDSGYGKTPLPSQISLVAPPILPNSEYMEDNHLTADSAQALSSLGSSSPSEMSLNERTSQCSSNTKVAGQTSSGTSDEEIPTGLQSPSNGQVKARITGPHVNVTDATLQGLRQKFDILRPKRQSGPQHLKSSVERFDLGDEFEPPLRINGDLDVPKTAGTLGHRKTPSWSSTGFVGTLRSRTTGLSSSSATARSHRGHWSRLSRLGKGGSRVSDASNRKSLESSRDFSPMMSKAAVDRAIQRRKILAELIMSESGFVNDLKILTHAYFTLLGTTQSIPKDKHIKIEVNTKAMISLHEEILYEMKSLSQDPIGQVGPKRAVPRLAKQIRCESIDSLKATFGRRKGLAVQAFTDHAKRSSLTAEPSEAAEVAGIFERVLDGSASSRMGRFSIYEEYGARYAEMLQVFAAASRTIPSWCDYEHAIEALVNALIQTNESEEENRKGLTFEDLLIKPIQRICRYPLLFTELESYSPAMDDPDSYAKIKRVLGRLRETAHEINDATNDLETQTRLNRSQQLQDLLAFPNTYRPSFSLTRDLGHAKLCGVLYVTYQSQKRQIRGEYLLCALFTSHILLASPDDGYKKFTIIAIIGLGNIQLKKATDGRGLQCQNALYTWKLMFQFDQKLYEVLFSACTEVEEECWKSGFDAYFAWKNQRHDDTDESFESSHSSLFLDVRQSAGIIEHTRVFRPGRSLKRSATTALRTHTIPVIIRNTQLVQRGDQMGSPRTASASLARSQSLMTLCNIPTLAPDRAERTRIEQAMSEVWTRGTLPYPAMTARRSGQFFRASASSMMRRLSKASVTSNSTRRSVSQTSAMGIGFDGALDDPFISRPNTAHVRSTNEEGVNDASAVLNVGREVESHNRPRVSFSLENVRNTREQVNVNTIGGTGNREFSDASTVVADTHGRQTRDMIKRPEKPEKPKKSKTLTKAFSAEKIKSWFS